jgi:gliding motility-associated transport system ATP-binding protein
VVQDQTMIQVANLTKDYGSKRAVNMLSFEVPSGEVLGFLGPNGAGKSTTMKILTCYLAPTSGTVRVAGHDVGDESLQVRQNVGYLPENTPLYRDMTSLEFLEFAAALRGVEPAQRQGRIRKISELCALLDVLGQPVGELSKGFRQRLGLAQAMVHDPPILILDEPTSGLDPNQIVEIRELIKKIGKEKTVILSTHILSEVEATCGRVIIIHHGKMVADGSTEELTHGDLTHDLAFRCRMVVATNGAHEAAETEERADDADDRAEEGPQLVAVREKLAAVDGVASISEVEQSPEGIGLLVEGKGTSDLRPELFRCVKDNGWVLMEMQRRGANLEAVFRKLTRPVGGE